MQRSLGFVIACVLVALGAGCGASTGTSAPKNPVTSFEVKPIKMDFGLPAEPAKPSDASGKKKQ